MLKTTLTHCVYKLFRNAQKLQPGDIYGHRTAEYKVTHSCEKGTHGLRNPLNTADTMYEAFLEKANFRSLL